MHDESTTRNKVEDVQEGALPPYLLDRDQTQRAKVIASSLLSSFIQYLMNVSYSLIVMRYLTALVSWHAGS